ncbi:MAG: hypothetical protein FJ196_05520 [Gammaproteobacteria bacterium]|nr:hypothetical protein [Gammaproteobacteria bacterium]
MRTHSSVQTLLSLVLILSSATYAYIAQINGFSGFALAAGATIISALVLGYFWRRPSKGGED